MPFCFKLSYFYQERLLYCFLVYQAYERSEDPIYVLENNIPIDTQYYLENQISKVSLVDCTFMWFYNLFLHFTCLLTVVEIQQPLLRLFEPILKNASKELLSGDHTRSISISTPSNSGIMKFAKRQLSCIGCKALIRYGLMVIVFF